MAKRKRDPLICQSCYEPEDFDDMVNCGKCHKWWHFACGGVGPKIKKNYWQCALCTVGKMSRQASHNVKSVKASKIPILMKNNKKIHTANVTASEMAEVQSDVEAVKSKQQTIMESVAATKAFAEAVGNDAKLLQSGYKNVTAAVCQLQNDFKTGKNEITGTLGAFAKAVQKDVIALHSDHKDIKATISQLQNDFGDIKGAMVEPKTVETRAPISTMLPTKSLDDLTHLLTHVGSVAGYLEFKAYISALCGTDIKDTIRTILFHIMERDVQKQLSWSGFRTPKPSFQHKFKRIVDAISETLNEKFKDYNYDILKKKCHLCSIVLE